MVKIVDALVVAELKKRKNELLDSEIEITLLKIFDWLSKNVEISGIFYPFNYISEAFGFDNAELGRAFTKLEKLGALDCQLHEINEKKCSLTPFGKMIVELALPFERAVFLLFASQFHDFSPHFAIMTAFMDYNDIWRVPNVKSPFYHQLLSATIASRQRYVNKHASDFLGAVEIFFDLLLHKGRFYESWLKHNGFNQNELEKFYFASIDLMEKLAIFGFKGCKNAIDALKNSIGLDKIISIDPISTTICSLIVGWALTRNTVTAQRQKLQENAEILRPVNNPATITIRVDMNVDLALYNDIEERINLSTYQAEIILRAAINSCTRLTDRFDDTKIQLSYEKENIISGTIQFKPVNLSHAIQFFKSDQKNLQRQHQFDNYTFKCSILIKNIQYPEIVRWGFEYCTGHKRLINHSPLQLPLYYIPFDQKNPETLPTINVKTCFTPCDDTRSIAVVAKHFSLSKDEDDWLLSVILPEHRLCYTLVNRFQVPTVDIMVCSRGENSHILTPQFNCQNLQDNKECVTEFNSVNAVSNQMVDILKDWSKKDIVDETRSDQLCALLKKLLNVVQKN